MSEIEIYHDFTNCNHYIPNKIINIKNHKQYIFQILSKKFGQKGPFLNFPKNAKASFFRVQRLGLVKKNEQILMNGLRKKCEKPPFLGILVQNGQFWTVFGQNMQNRIFSKKRLEHFFRLSEF